MTDETRKGLGLDVARDDPLGLRWLILHMPKGGDLDLHLSGAIYAESYIRAAVEDHLCVDSSSYSLSKPRSLAGSQPICGNHKVPIAQAYRDKKLYSAVVDAFSMHAFVPSAGVSAHDHFSSVFEKFSAIYTGHLGEWLDEVIRRAAAQNEQYLEITTTLGVNRAAAIAQQVGWRKELRELREVMFKQGLRDDVRAAKAILDQAEAARRKLEHCGDKDEQPDDDKDYWLTPPCKVQVRYLFEVDRENLKEVVFAQALLGFEIASGDPRVVGINLVGQEDSYLSMADYRTQMKMLGLLRTLYPNVHVSVHASEFGPGGVPPEQRCCHIRLAMLDAHAERIDNGADIMVEYRPHNLMREQIIARHAAVVLNLTNNAATLDAVGNKNALSTYMMLGTPLTVATGDEGVLRTDITNEYVQAFLTYGLHYGDLKRMVRASLEHSFLPGASLWAQPDAFKAPNSACVGDKLGVAAPSAPCQAFLQSSEKARQQWELERRLQVFEADP